MLIAISELCNLPCRALNSAPAMSTTLPPPARSSLPHGWFVQRFRPPNRRYKRVLSSGNSSRSLLARDAATTTWCGADCHGHSGSRETLSQDRWCHGLLDPRPATPHRLAETGTSTLAVTWNARRWGAVAGVATLGDAMALAHAGFNAPPCRRTHRRGSASLGQPVFCSVGTLSDALSKNLQTARAVRLY